MIKRRLGFILSLLLCFISITPVYASSNEIYSLDIDCVILNDGNAAITETWDMNIENGTEVYKVFSNMHNKALGVVSVSDNNKNLEHVDKWNINSSRSQKAHKYGVVAKGGSYELCVGFGEYGKHQIVMTYKVKNFIDQYKDAQGINYAFFSDMSLPIEKAHISVTSSAYKFNKDTAKIWAFGYKGQVVFSNDNIELTADDSINGGKMQLLAKLEDGKYTNVDTFRSNMKFDAVKKEALKGSSYREKTFFEKVKDMFWRIFSFIFLGGWALVLLAALITYIQDKLDKGPKDGDFEDGIKFNEKDVPMFHDLPTKNILYAYYLMTHTKHKPRVENLINAYLLKWIQKGDCEFVSGKEEGRIFKHATYTIDFTKRIETDSAAEDKLAYFFRTAAGDNHLLETKEFEDYCSENYEKVHK